MKCCTSLAEGGGGGEGGKKEGRGGAVREMKKKKARKERGEEREKHKSETKLNQETPLTTGEVTESRDSTVSRYICGS